MATGSVFAKFTNKKIAGFTDFGPRMLDYLKELNRDSVQARFDVDGVFNTLHGLAGGVNTVSITGTSRETDGLGHTMRVSSSAFGVSALFQNTVAIVYHVGLRYCEIPVNVSVNPRTGLPEYASFKEEIGEVGVPNSVVNNGSTLTFIVDNVTESGVSNAGRTVRVYKLVPADGATTEAIAIEDRTVAFDGTNNKITTAGLLGQSSPSTTAADYVVVMLGITVKRNTNLESSSNHCFIGTVTGVGAGGTPVTFSTTLQRLLKTFTDATQVLFTPYGWITHTNIQAALQDVVDVLGDAGTSNPGAVRIGTNPVAFTKAKPTAFADGAGGIGTVADGTFSGSKDLQTILVAVNAALDRHRGYTKTFGGTRGVALGNTATNGLRPEGLGDSAFNGGTWFLQGTGGYSLITDSAHMNLNSSPYVMGESCGPNSGTSRTAIALTSAASEETWVGKWQRVSIDQDGSLNGSLVTNGGLKCHHVTIAGGLLRHKDNSGARSPVQFESCLFSGTHRTTNPGTLTINGATAGSAYWGDYDGCYFESDAGASAVVWLTHTTGGGSEVVDDVIQRKVKFTNSFFKSGENHPVLSDTGSADEPIMELVFDSCTFRSDDSFLTSAAFMSLARTKRVTFRSCNFHDRGGNGMIFTNAVFDDCRFFIGKISQVDNRRRMLLTDCEMSKCFITIYDCGNVTSAGIQVIDVSGGRFDKVTIKFNTASDQMPTNADALRFDGSDITNMIVDFNLGNMGTANGASGAQFSLCNISGLRLSNIPGGRDTADNTTTDYVLFDSCRVDNLLFSLSTAKAFEYRSAIGLFSTQGANFTGSRSAVPNYSDSAIRLSGLTTVKGLQLGIGAWRTVGEAKPVVHLVGATVSTTQGSKLYDLRYTELTGNNGDMMVKLENDLNTLADCHLVGGARDGAFGGNIVLSTGKADIITANHMEWSPPSNVAGMEAVKTTGDFPNLTNNQFAKDVSVAASGTSNYFAHSGTGNNDQLNNFREI